VIKNVFITGGLGQDGIIISKLLNKKKINLNIITRSKKSFKKINNNKINYIISNLLSKKKIENMFKKVKPDIVLHLASNNPSYHENNYKKFYEDNLITTKNIFYSTFNANKKARFISCSSSQIFKKKNGVVNEKSILLATTNYTKFRIDSNNFMLNFKKKHKIRYTNIILFNHDSKFRNKKFIIPRVINAILKKDIKFLNNIIKENIACDFSHAEDICVGIRKIILSKNNFDSIILSSNKLESLNKIIFYIIKKNRINIEIIDKKKPLQGLIGNNLFAKKKLKWIHKKNIFNAANEIYQTYKNLNIR
jgi:GDPmannose 4,6-dehydratase